MVKDSGKGGPRDGLPCLCKQVEEGALTIRYYSSDSKVDRVANFTYLGTILDSKMNFKLNVEHIVKKARKCIFIMKQLSFLKIAKPIRMRCYVTSEHYTWTRI